MSEKPNASSGGELTTGHGKGPAKPLNGCLALLAVTFGLPGVLVVLSQGSDSCAPSTVAPTSPSHPQRLQQPKAVPVPTALSQTALGLHSGMARADVLMLLGPPTWGFKGGDVTDLAPEPPYEALRLHWENGPDCGHVEATFNSRGKLIGSDAGLTCQMKGLGSAVTAKIDAKFRCERRPKVCFQ